METEVITFPVICRNKKCYIISQNHGYEVIVNENSVWKPLFVNSNDNSNEGLIHTEKPFFSVQFHQKQEQDLLIPSFYLISLLRDAPMNLM